MSKEFLGIWKDFELGLEYRIAGTFIYDGLKALEEMTYLEIEEEIFSVLYHLSVGIERLMKVVIFLDKSFENLTEEEFKKKMNTHSTQFLFDVIQKNHKINLNKECNKLLSLLTNFYSNHRYSHIEIEKSLDPSTFRKEIEEFKEFISLILGYKNVEQLDSADYDMDRIKDLFGRNVKRIISPLSNIISENSRNTDELATYHYKPLKIFMKKEFNFFPERKVKHLALIYLLTSNDNRINQIKSFLKSEEVYADFPDHIETETIFNSFISEYGNLMLESSIEDLIAWNEGEINVNEDSQIHLNKILAANIMRDSWFDEQ